MQSVAGVEGLVAEMSREWADHGARVRVLARHLGATLGLSGDRLRRLEVSAALHDIGKAQLDDRVLRVPRTLTATEWDHVRTHPQLGFDMVDGLVHAEIASAVLNHHERWDGTGYPHGRAGRRIPLLARILSVADAIDAMISERVYQGALPLGYALDELERYSGSQFDPLVVRAAKATIGPRRMVPLAATA